MENPRARLEEAESRLVPIITEYMLQEGFEYNKENIQHMVEAGCIDLINFCVNIYYTEVRPDQGLEIIPEINRSPEFYIYFVLNIMIENDDDKYTFSKTPREYNRVISEHIDRLRSQEPTDRESAILSHMAKGNPITGKPHTFPLSAPHPRFEGTVFSAFNAPSVKGSWQEQINERDAQDALIRMGLDPQKAGPDTDFGRAVNYARMVGQNVKTRLTVPLSERKHEKGKGKKQKKSKKLRKSRKQKKQRKTMRK